jgi:hypothetical protein
MCGNEPLANISLTFFRFYHPLEVADGLDAARATNKP